MDIKPIFASQSEELIAEKIYPKVKRNSAIFALRWILS